MNVLCLNLTNSESAKNELTCLIKDAKCRYINIAIFDIKNTDIVLKSKTRH